MPSALTSAARGSTGEGLRDQHHPPTARVPVQYRGQRAGLRDRRSRGSGPLRHARGGGRASSHHRRLTWRDLQGRLGPASHQLPLQSLAVGGAPNHWRRAAPGTRQRRSIGPRIRPLRAPRPRRGRDRGFSDVDSSAREWSRPRVLRQAAGTAVIRSANSTTGCFSAAVRRDPTAARRLTRDPAVRRP